jgi:prolyl-tRNA synthetase
MRWSQLFIPTLREAPAAGEPRWRMWARAGYLRPAGQGVDYLLLGQRSLAKIAGHLRRELEAVGGQEVALTASGPEAMCAAAHGGIRSYKQLPQLWFQFRDGQLDACAFGGGPEPLREAVRRALRACGVRAAVGDPEGGARPEPFATPGVKTIAELAAFTALPESRLIKSVVMEAAGDLVLVALRGDHSLSEAKLSAALGVPVRSAGAEEIRDVFGADPGSLGPVGVRGVRILADTALAGRANLICGANRDGYHLRYVTPGRDFTAEFHELRAAAPGPGQTGVPVIAEPGAVLGGVRAGIATFQVLGEAGAAYPPATTAVELALDRLLLAAARYDEAGLILPPGIAPFSVVFTPVNMREEALRATAEQLYQSAQAAGWDALLDDRDERAGVKFKDAELVGIPWRVTLGKKLAEGLVEVTERNANTAWEAPTARALEFLRERWALAAA